MMKVKIKSLDNFNQNYEKLFELEKVLEQKEKKEYYYGDEYGNCKIIDKGDSIEIYRYGEINSRQIFQSNKNTPFTYITKQFHGKYKIFTKKIQKENRKIVLEYDIIHSNEVINSITLELQFIDAPSK